MAAPITVSDVLVYLGGISGASGTSWSTPSASGQVQAALDAEYANQLRKCSVVGASATYPDDLAEALKRRVARNLQMRAAPLAVLQGDAETGGAAFIPRRDPEIARLEAPWIRLVVG